MKKIFMFLILLMWFNLPALSRLRSVKISDVNISMFKDDSGAPTESYREGMAEFYILEMEGLNSGKTISLFFDFFSKSGEKIYKSFLGDESKYDHIANPQRYEGDFSIKDLTFLNEKYTNSSRLLCVYVLCDKQNIAQDPYVIRIQIYENGELYLSASMEYSLETWINLKSILEFFIGVPLDGYN